MSDSKSVKRPIGVYVLVVLAGIMALLSAVYTLQSLGILPYFIGSVAVRAFSFFNALMWGLLVWVYAWLTSMLWKMNPMAWVFLAVITVVNLTINFTLLLGATTWVDVSVSFIINALILIYVMLPHVRRAFGQR